MPRRMRTWLAALVLVAASVGAVTVAAGATGATAGKRAADDVVVRVGTHNVLHGKGAFRAFGHVVGWQEVDSPAARDKLRRSLPAYKHFFPKDGAAKSVPISWRADRFELVKSGSIRTHRGEAKVTPSRYVNWVLLKQPAKNKRFLVLNTHFISGAWTKHPNRQARWLRHADRLRDLVKKLGDQHPNTPIVLVGDFNRHKTVALPHQVQHIKVAGVAGVPIDQMYATKSVKNTQVQRLDKAGSDHFAYRFTATF